MTETVTIDQLAGAITQAVKEYTDDVSEAIAREVDDASDYVLKEARRLAPKRSGKYARSLKRTQPKSRNRKGSKHLNYYVIWSPTQYRVVHLNERGFTHRSGKRVEGKPHLRPAYDQRIPQMEANINRIIKEGG